MVRIYGVTEKKKRKEKPEPFCVAKTFEDYEYLKEYREDPA